MAHAPSFQSSYCTQTFHRSQMLPAVLQRDPTCEGCVRKGARKASATDLEPSAFVGSDPEERQDRRLDQRRPLAGVASQARRRPIMKRSRDADLLCGISHNQRVGITCFWLTLAKIREGMFCWGASSSVCRAEMRPGVLGSGGERHLVV